jgi:hypothetical protein
MKKLSGKLIVWRAINVSGACVKQVPDTTQVEVDPAEIVARALKK